MVPCLHRTTVECTPEQNPESQTHLYTLRLKPACECYCHNRKPRRPLASTPTWHQRAPPLIPSTSSHIAPVLSHEVQSQRREIDQQEHNRSMDREHLFDPLQRLP